MAKSEMWSMLNHVSVSHTKQAFRRGLSLHIYLQFKMKKKQHNISMQPLKTVTLCHEGFSRDCLFVSTYLKCIGNSCIESNRAISFQVTELRNKYSYTVTESSDQSYILY